MCSASKPDMPKPKPLPAPKAPAEETTVQLGSGADESKKRKKKSALGTRQLMIPTGGANTVGGSGLSL